MPSDKIKEWSRYTDFFFSRYVGWLSFVIYTSHDKTRPHSRLILPSSHHRSMTENLTKWLSLTPVSDFRFTTPTLWLDGTRRLKTWGIARARSMGWRGRECSYPAISYKCQKDDNSLAINTSTLRIRRQFVKTEDEMRWDGRLQESGIFMEFSQLWPCFFVYSCCHAMSFLTDCLVCNSCR